jgi:hypothetical protein
MNEICFLHRNQRQLMAASGDGVMRVQHVRKWCREFENGRTGIHDTNRISRPNTSRTAVNAARVKLIFGPLICNTWEVAVYAVMRKWKWPFVSGCEYTSLISAATEFLTSRLKVTLLRYNK